VRLDVREWVMMQTNKADKVKKSKMGIREELVEVAESWRARGERRQTLEDMKAYCKIHRGTKNNLRILHCLMS
jgi:hypothetical protein